MPPPVVSRIAPDFEGERWYQAGYTDGCSSAVESGKSFSTKAVRNDALYDTDAGYRAGWRQGFAACEQRTRRDDGTFNDEQNPYF